jgi:hypothetical protein
MVIAAATNRSRLLLEVQVKLGPKLQEELLSAMSQQTRSLREMKEVLEISTLNGELWSVAR